MNQPNPVRTPFATQLRHTGIWSAGVLLWLAMIGYGFFLLFQHDTSALEPQALDSIVASDIQDVSWVSEVDLRPASGKFNLIVAIHPKCPCTRNTLAEIERIQARFVEKCELTFLVTLPGGKPEEEIEQWRNSGTVQLATSMPNAAVWFEDANELTTRLGLNSSGAVVVLDELGQIRFAGGITAGRSCAMENPGSQAVVRILRGDEQPLISTPVFGYRLPKSEEESPMERKRINREAT